MVELRELVAYTDSLLDVASFRDYCPNGLQVEGRSRVRVLVSGVTASLALLEAAERHGADAILVHHGYFWKGESPCITGMKRQRLRRLLEADMSLLAYHLPLDAHPTYGNNVQLAAVLGFEVHGRFGPGEAPDIALHGVLPEALEGEALAGEIERRLGRAPLHVAGKPGPIQRIGWCTGAAQDFVGQAAELGLDAFVSGEISEQTVHVARETGIHFFAAGHHATERYGAPSLAGHLAEQFGLDHTFVDIDNPV